MNQTTAKDNRGNFELYLFQCDDKSYREKGNKGDCTYMNITDGLEHFDTNEYGRIPAMTAEVMGRASAYRVSDS